MKDPDRLLSSGATDFERLVLRAAQAEQPSFANRRRMRRALLLAEFGFLTTGFKAVASAANHVVLVAVLAGAMAGGGSSRVAPRADSTATATSSDGAPTNSSEVARQATEQRDSTSVAAIPVEQLTLEATSKSEKAPTRPHSQPKTIDLREEILLLDQVRTAIRVGNQSQALAAANQYLARFPRGSFRQEAAVLRVEALALSGNHARAAAESKAFIVKHPQSPHVEKLKQLTDREKP